MFPGPLHLGPGRHLDQAGEKQLVTSTVPGPWAQVEPWMQPKVLSALPLFIRRRELPIALHSFLRKGFLPVAPRIDSQGQVLGGLDPGCDTHNFRLKAPGDQR